MIRLAFQNEKAVVYEGDCLEVMQRMVDEGVQVDSIVTDPPYEIGFMGKKCDASGIAYNTKTWELALALLKPGGHLLAFGGTRTYHRMTCAIEDAGFEIRDCIMWVYGQGFPKSLDISKAIDKKAGAEREIVGRRKHPTLKDSSLIEEAANAAHGDNTWAREWDISAPATDAAKRWEGWGTALKPSLEPIVMARKPLIGTVAENVLEHGVGGLNIDGCRIGTEGGTSRSDQNEYPKTEDGKEDRSQHWARTGHKVVPLNTGRFPANLIHDGSDDVLERFPIVHGAGKARDGSEAKVSDSYSASSYMMPKNTRMRRLGDSGSSARFFYCAKASKKDRNGSKHPTVKPIKLMEYLCRLVTPPGGIVLDPFGGSGTTARAAINEGFGVVIMDRQPEYVLDIIRRLEEEQNNNVTLESVLMMEGEISS